jgi:hypothetical protein
LVENRMSEPIDERGVAPAAPCPSLARCGRAVALQLGGGGRSIAMADRSVGFVTDRPPPRVVEKIHRRERMAVDQHLPGGANTGSRSQHAFCGLHYAVVGNPTHDGGVHHHLFAAIRNLLR